MHAPPSQLERPSEPQQPSAFEFIRDDLGRLRTRRRVALGLYSASVAFVVWGLSVLPRAQSDGRVGHDGAWTVAMAFFALSCLVASAAAIGVPLVSSARFHGLTGIAALGVLAALLIVAEWTDVTASPIWPPGLKCFSYGTALSMIAMIALGVLSARVWRRFPDPGLAAAIATASLGIMALHIGCGAQDALHLFGFHLTPVLIAYGTARLVSGLRDRLDRAGL